VLADLVDERGVGVALPPEDVEAWSVAIERLLDDDDERRRIADRLEHVRAELTWANAAAALRRLVEAAPRTHRLRLARGALEAESLALRAEAAYSIGGVRGIVSRKAAGAAHKLRR
jgi:hypothetical protein